MHIFKYSRRKGTRADEMPEQIPEAVKKERSRILLTLAEEDSARFREKLIGKEREVLIEEEQEIEGQRYYTGFDETYVRYYIPKEDSLPIGKIYTVYAEKVQAESILGKILKIRS